MPGTTSVISLDWKLRLPFVHFRFLMVLNQQGKKGVKVLRGMIDPDYNGKMGLPLYNGDKKDYVWNVGDPLVCLCPVITVNWKLQQPNPGRMAKGTVPPRMMVWVITPGKDPRPADMLTENGANAK